MILETFESAIVSYTSAPLPNQSKWKSFKLRLRNTAMCYVTPHLPTFAGYNTPTPQWLFLFQQADKEELAFHENSEEALDWLISEGTIICFDVREKTNPDNKLVYNHNQISKP